MLTEYKRKEKNIFLLQYMKMMKDRRINFRKKVLKYCLNFLLQILKMFLQIKGKFQFVAYFIQDIFNYKK